MSTPVASSSVQEAVVAARPWREYGCIYGIPSFQVDATSTLEPSPTGPSQTADAGQTAVSRSPDAPEASASAASAAILTLEPRQTVASRTAGAAQTAPSQTPDAQKTVAATVAVEVAS